MSKYRLSLFQQKVGGIKSAILLLFIITAFSSAVAQTSNPTFHYTLSIPDPASQQYEVELSTSGWKQDTVTFTMPAWMPGYYQFMHYADDVVEISAYDEAGKEMMITKVDQQSWQVIGVKEKPFTIGYVINTHRQFVANSYVDSAHAYIIPTNTFLFVEGYQSKPIRVEVNKVPGWSQTFTGLDFVEGSTNTYFASDFDILYDSPFMLGNFEELPSFEVNGIKHRFVGYQMGEFDQKKFIETLHMVVETAVGFIGDIPYQHYTFMAIGPGRGGIEHLNNTTVSFNGEQLNTEAGVYQMMSFLAHEYFHHYNVKRIRPYELGPFDYVNGSRTNQLWVSEGLTVYYEYLIVNRAGLSSDSVMIQSFEKHIDVVENNPGRFVQSLAQSSYQTWEDGPFGNKNAGQSISYYQKGPIVGLLLDFAIRDATQNERSLDDVMRYVYWEYYKKKRRGFTEAEFQQACEKIAGIPLTALFEYVYTTKALDYNTYLNKAGLTLTSETVEDGRKAFHIERLENPTPMQQAILDAWLGKE